MKTIDARKRLNAEHMHELLSSATLYNVSLDGLFVETSLSESQLREMFETQKYGSMADESIMTIESSDVQLTLIGIDYHYWRTARRLNKLFGEPVIKKVKAEKIIETIKVAVAVIDFSNMLIDIKDQFEGTKKEAIEFINRQNAMIQMKSFFEDVPVFVIGYDDMTDLSDPEIWHTLEEYEQQGVIE